MNNRSECPVYIGSQLVPTETYLRQFVLDLKRISEKSHGSTSADLVAAHQAMVLYTLQMVFACTGHRAVSDPFWNLDHFDLQAGQVLIDDKSVASQLGARLAWLPPRARRQIQLYLLHLRSLSRLVRMQNPVLADQLWAITEPGFPRPIPFFFFLEADGNGLAWARILPSGLAPILEPLWVLPLNSNRHILPTWLYESGCPSECIDAQLGHIEAGCAPFGSLSTLAPDDAGRILHPLLERFLEFFGWSEVQGLRAPSRIPNSAPNPKAKTLASTPPALGSAVRLAKREALWRKDSERVIDLFKRFFPIYPPSSISNEQLKILEEKIIAEGQRQGRVLVHLILFRRHLIKLRKNGTHSSLPGRLSIIKPERHSFAETSITTKLELDRLRMRFTKYLAEQEGSPCSYPRRIAELLISSILFGAQTSLQFLVRLPVAIKNSVWRLEEHAFVDVSLSESSPIRRWQPDRISKALLVGLHETKTHQLEPTAATDIENDIAQNLNAILKQLEPRGSKIIKKKLQPISRQLAPLCELASVAWKFALPGVISEYAMGEHACASTPLSNWLRLVNGKVGAVSTPPAQTETTTVADDITRIPRPKESNQTRNRSTQNWIALTRCFSGSTLKESDKITESAKDRTSKSNRSNARKQKFEERMTALLEKDGENFSPVVSCLAAWALHLCRHGTRHTPILRANSVSTYVRTIGSTLTELAYDKDFLSLSSIVLEDLFRNVVATAPRQNQVYVVNRLREFHHFLRSQYGVPELDWSEVIDDEFLEADAVDAGIVTLAEYHRALHVILASADSDERTRRVRSVLLILIYRFGLRVGEAFRLTVSDILCHLDQVILFVRNSIYGETKTDHGMRQLPLIGTLSNLEKQLLTQWLAHSKEYADKSPLALLFPEPDDNRHGVERTVTVAAMVNALRIACGDENMRLRHLRHTCASRLFLAMVCPDLPTGLTGQIYRALWEEHPPEEIRMLLVGDAMISRRTLYAVALYMGHASPKTTLRHYIHCADLILKNHVDDIEVHISDKALAYCYQLSYSNLRKIRSRLNDTADDKHADHALGEELLRRSNVPQPNFEAKNYVSTEHNIEPTVRNLEPAELDRLLTIATMRKTIDGLGNRFLCSDASVVQTLTVATQLQDSLGYADFGLPIKSPDDYWIAPKFVRRATLDKESGRVRKFLRIISSNQQRLEAITQFAGIWAKSYLPNSTPLLLTRKSDLKKIIDSWEAMDMSAKDFEAILPRVKTRDREFLAVHKRKHQLIALGLRVRQIARLAYRTVPEVPTNRVGLVLRPAQSHMLGYQVTLDRVLFVVAVWKHIQEASCSQSEESNNL